jgi:parallel beta-helix repeat protein
MRNPIVTSSLGKISITLFLISLFIVPITATTDYQITTPPIPQPSFTVNLTVYVDGNNTHGPWNGTIQDPYQFIQQGIDNVLPNGTVIVFPGTYRETIVINKINISIIGQGRNDTIIDGRGFDTVVRFTHDKSTIANFTITNSGNQSNDSGITLNAHNCTVTKNNITQNYYGIYSTADGNNIFFNTFYNNTRQASSAVNNTWDNGSTGNFWSDQLKTDIDENGIVDNPYSIAGIGQDRFPLLHPYGSIVNRQTNKEFLTIKQAINDSSTNDGQLITVAAGIYPEHIIVNRKLMIEGQNQTRTILDGSSHGTIIRLTAPDTTLKGFTLQNSGTSEFDSGLSIEQQNAYATDLLIQNNHHGVYFKVNGSNSLLYRCTIRTNAWNGVYILSCTGNKLTENIIQDNGFAGVMVFDASYNTIYHCTFLNNRLQAFDNGFNLWDNGYPSGGNRWSDYTGPDANHDGIGDVPYIIPGGTGQDRYPLMNSFQGNDTTKPYVNITSPTNGLYIGSRQFLKRILPGRIIALGSITIDVNASDILSGVKEVRFYIDDRSEPETTLYTPPYTWTWRGFTPIKHTHTITAVVSDFANNTAQDVVVIRHWL